MVRGADMRGRGWGVVGVVDVQVDDALLQERRWRAGAR